MEGVSFRVQAGEHAMLMGRTGCGKTSLLEAICGLRSLYRGQIFIDGHDMTHTHPSQRGIGYVPQDAALFRSMTVRENMAFALSIRKWTEKEIDVRVNELGALLHLSGLLNRKIKGLSGGETQRVALGRALSFRPSVLCMDEPLSALDDETRHEMYELLKDVRRHTKVTILHVSHHRGDAENLADRVLNLKGSVILGRQSPLNGLSHLRGDEIESYS